MQQDAYVAQHSLDMNAATTQIRPNAGGPAPKQWSLLPTDNGGLPPPNPQSPDARDRNKPTPGSSLLGLPPSFPKKPTGLDPFNAIGDIAGSAINNVGTAWDRFVEQSKTPTSSTRPPGVGNLQASGLNDVANSLLGVAGAPFTGISGGINLTEINADPALKAEYDRRIQQLPISQQQRATVQMTVAREATDWYAAKLLRALDDPNVPDESKRAAAAVAGALTLQRVAELGGPWAVHELSRLASLGARTVARDASTLRDAGFDPVAERARTQEAQPQGPPTDYSGGGQFDANGQMQTPGRSRFDAIKAGGSEPGYAGHVATTGVDVSNTALSLTQDIRQAFRQRGWTIRGNKWLDEKGNEMWGGTTKEMAEDPIAQEILRSSTAGNPDWGIQPLRPNPATGPDYGALAAQVRTGHIPGVPDVPGFDYQQAIADGGFVMTKDGVRVRLRSTPGNAPGFEGQPDVVMTDFNGQRKPYSVSDLRNINPPDSAFGPAAQPDRSIASGWRQGDTAILPSGGRVTVIRTGPGPEGVTVRDATGSTGLYNASELQFNSSLGERSVGPYTQTARDMAAGRTGPLILDTRTRANTASVRGPAGRASRPSDLTQYDYTGSAPRSSPRGTFGSASEGQLRQYAFDQNAVVRFHGVPAKDAPSTEATFGVVRSTTYPDNTIVVWRREPKGGTPTPWTPFGLYHDGGPGATTYQLLPEFQGQGLGSRALVAAQRLTGRVNPGISYSEAGFANRVAAHKYDIRARLREEAGGPDVFTTKQLRSKGEIGPGEYAIVPSDQPFDPAVLEPYPDLQAAYQQILDQRQLTETGMFTVAPQWVPLETAAQDIEMQAFKPRGIVQRVADFLADEGGMARLDMGLTGGQKECGTCYQQAFEYLSGKQSQPGDVIVHGFPEYRGSGPNRGEKFGHAWIERDTTIPLPDNMKKALGVDTLRQRVVIDPTVTTKDGKALAMPAEAYYAMGHVNPAEVRTYTKDQAYNNALRTKRYGTWDEPPAGTVFQDKHGQYQQQPGGVRVYNTGDWAGKVKGPKAAVAAWLKDQGGAINLSAIGSAARAFNREQGGGNQAWIDHFRAGDEVSARRVAERMTGVKGALTPLDTPQVVAARTASRAVASAEGVTSTHLIASDAPVRPDGLRARSADFRARGEAALKAADLPGLPEDHAVFADSLAQQAEAGTLTRGSLRTQIADHLYNLQTGIGTDKILDMWIGLPASGKSTMMRSLPPEMLAHQPRIVSADQAKLFLPEFMTGEGAGLVHEESSGIKRAIEARAIQAGENISLTSVGDDLQSVTRRAAQYKPYGYQVRLHLLNVDPFEAAQRSVTRMQSTGRLVDPQRILEIGLADGPRKLYTEGRRVADGWEEYASGSVTEAGGTLARNPVLGEAGRPGALVPGGRQAVSRAGQVDQGRSALPSGQVVPDRGPGAPGVTATAEDLIRNRAAQAGADAAAFTDKGNAPNFGAGNFPPGAQSDLLKMQDAVQPDIAAARPHIGWSEQNAPTDKPIWELAASMPRAGEISIPAAQLRQAVASILEETQRYRNAIDDGTITPQQTAEYGMKLRIAALGRIADIGAVSEGGRTLQGVQMPLRTALRTSATSRAMDELFVDLAKNDPGKLDQLSTALSTVGNDPRKVIRMMKMVATKPDFWSRFDEYYRGNVLWNVATHITNFSSGLIQQFLLGARETAMLATDIPQIGVRQAGIEEIAMLRGWAGGYTQAFDMLRGAKDMLPMSADKYGGAMGFNRSGALGYGGGFFGLGKYYGPIIRTPFRFLEAADLFQTSPMYNGLLARNAYRLAWKEGVRGMAKLDARAQELIRTLPDELDAEGAFKSAEQFALHGTGDLAESIIKLRQKAPFMRPIVLFVNTPANLITMSGKFSPFGYARAGVGAFKALKGLPTEIDPKEAFIEASIGSAVTAGFGMMLAGDNAMGLTPKSKAEQAAWEAEGRQPLSIRASEYPLLGPALRAYYAARGEDASKVWVGPQFLGPLLIPYLIAASYNEVTRKPSPDPIEQQALVAAFNAGKTLMDQVPLFSTYSMITNALDVTNPDAVGRLAARLGLPLIPVESLIKMVSDMTDAWSRDPKTFQEVLQATFPILREGVRPKLDVLGKQIPNHIVPFDVGPRAKLEQPEDPVLTKSEELRNANPEEWSGLTKPGRTVGATDLSYDEHHRYQELAGEERRKLLSTLINMPEFNRLAKSDQAKAFSVTNTEALREARKKLGIEMVSAARDSEHILTGTQIALAGANGNYEKGQVLQQLTAQGKLKPDVSNQLDAKRTQSNPVLASYELSVAEYMRGADLVDKWRAAPAFVTGESANAQDWPKEWSAAQDAAVAFNAIQDSMVREAKLKSIPIQQLPSYDALVNYYQRAANGLFARYYTLSGTVRSGLVSQERKQIQADPLWTHFSGSAEPQPAVPYRFPVPMPVLPSAGAQQDQQLAASA